MKKILLISFAFFYHIYSFSQCPSYNINLSSQADINNFKINYPNCTEIGFGLTITGNTITNLNGLNEVTRVENNLIIRESLLVNLNGLNKLTYVGGGFTISSNVNLINTQGLDNLLLIEGRVEFSFNPKLKDLKGLESLDAIRNNFPYEDGELVITSNNGLQSLEGLENLSSTIGLEITNNPLLINFEGLNGLTTIDKNFRIAENSNLISFSGLYNLKTINGRFLPEGSNALTTFVGLGSLTTIGEFYVGGSQFQNFNGLNVLNSIGQLTVIGNPLLESFNGLESVTNLSQGYLYIGGNDKLNNLNGLININSGGENANSNPGIFISNNKLLTSLSGLDNFDFNGTPYSINLSTNAVLNDISALNNWSNGDLQGLTITNNGQLSICQIGPICSFINRTVPVYPTVSGNSGNCEDLQSLTIACSPSPECPTGEVVLSSQLEVDNFSTNFPYCTKPEQNIIIEGDDITNLNGLGVITDIIGNMIIKNNPNLTSLYGLEKLVFVSGELMIQNNAELVHIRGAASIDGLSLNRLIITNNPKLSNCSVATVCNFMAKNMDAATISGNTGDCSSEFDVMMKCNDLCPSGNIVIRTQADIDNFKINYPNCTVPEGLSIYGNKIQNLDGLDLIMATKNSLTIRGTNYYGHNSTLTDLTGLSSLRHVGGQLLISNNGLLTNLSGFESLKYVGGDMRLGYNINSDEGNPLLENLDGLRSLEYVGGEFVVEEQNSLIDFIGLEKLRHIGRGIKIEYNDLLISLSGLDNLEMSQLNGGLEISSNPSLQSLSNLSSLTEIGKDEPGFNGSLRIYNNDNLIDISGLSNVKSISDQLQIHKNALLDNLSGLESVTEIGNLLVIKDNAKLKSIAGLSNLNSALAIWINFNKELINLNGLGNVTSLQGGLQITGNDELISIDGIPNLSLSPSNYLSIYNNPKLAICNQTNTCEFLSYSNKHSIHDNATGCDSSVEILELCASNINTISGFVKYSSNDTDCNTLGLPIPNIAISTSNGTKSYKTFTNETGGYKLLIREGSFETSGQTNTSYFEFSPNNQQSVFTGLGNSDLIDFCVSPVSSVNDLNVILIPLSESRPGFDTDYKLVYKNSGSTVLDGFITLNFDSTKLNYQQSVPSENALSGSQLQWNYSNLKPFESRSILVTFKIAAPPVANNSEEISFISVIYPNDNDISPKDNTFSFEQILIGSYDPNDKTVVEGGNLLINEIDNYLNYVIRFQNTGTASAINVKIRDELSLNLDWGTFVPVSSSHPNSILITDGNKVEFIFDNINLPDKTSDESASHGYVAFKIKPKPNTVVGDLITGKASIFFDFNEPIITNTVNTEITSTLSNPDFETVSVNIFPIPSKGIIYIKSSRRRNIKNIILYSTNGSILIRQNQDFDSIDISSLSKGIYFVKIVCDSGDELTKKIIKY